MGKEGGGGAGELTDSSDCMLPWWRVCCDIRTVCDIDIIDVLTVRRMYQVVLVLDGDDGDVLALF